MGEAKSTEAPTNYATYIRLARYFTWCHAVTTGKLGYSAVLAIAFYKAGDMDGWITLVQHLLRTRRLDWITPSCAMIDPSTNIVWARLCPVHRVCC
jgi:hypothetical protein